MKFKKRDKKDILILVLGIVAVILALILIYVFLIQPTITGMVSEYYYAGQSDTIYSIVEYVKTCQQLPLTFNNETINIVAVECIT